MSNARLLEGAVRVIAERGYRAASLQAIGEAAGYSRGLVSHRFGSKEGLLNVLLENVPDPWAEALRGLSGPEAMRAGARVHRDLLIRAPNAMRALYRVMNEAQGELAELRPRFIEYERVQRNRYVQALRAGQKKGTVRKEIDPQAMASIQLALMRGITMMWALDERSIDLTRVFAALDEAIVRALSP